MIVTTISARGITTWGFVHVHNTKAMNMATRKKKTPTGRGAKDLQDWLDESFVEYHFDPALDVTKIDIAQSLNNQARLIDRLNEERVQTYAEAMENGAEFPPLVVYVDEDGKYVVIDGNHRLQAWLLNDATTVPAWVVDTDDSYTLVALTYEANARHGQPNTPEERMQHALHLVRSGVPQGDAAFRMQVKASDLSVAWRKAEADRRATSLGIKRITWNKISATARSRLHALRNDQVFKKAVDATDKLSLSATEVSELVGDINRERTNSAQLKYLDEYIKKNSAKMRFGGGKAKSPRKNLVITCRSLLTLLDRKDIFDDLAQAEHQEMLRLLKEVGSKANRKARELS